MNNFNNCKGCKKIIKKDLTTNGVIKKYCSKDCYTTTLKNKTPKNMVHEMNNNNQNVEKKILEEVEETKKEQASKNNDFQPQEMTASEIITKVVITLISVALFAVVAYSAFTWLKVWFLCSK